MKINKRMAVKNLQTIIDVVRTTRGKERDLLVQFIASLTLATDYRIHLESLRALNDQLRSSCAIVLTAVLVNEFGLIETWGVCRIQEIHAAANPEWRRRYDESRPHPSKERVQRDLLDAIMRMTKCPDSKNKK